MNNAARLAGAQFGAIIEGFEQRWQIFYDIGHRKFDPMHAAAGRYVR